MPSVNNETELKRAAEIEAECKTCKSEYYGTGINVSINVKEEAAVSKLEDGSLWLLNVTSGSALGMQFYFDRFVLPKGAKLFIYNYETQVIRAGYNYKF